MKESSLRASHWVLALAVCFLCTWPKEVFAQERGGQGNGKHHQCRGDCPGSGNHAHRARAAGRQGQPLQPESRSHSERRADQELFHYLLDHRQSIRRTITQLPDGVETVTVSDDSEVVAAIRRRVRSMHLRLKEGRRIHMRDPLFAAVFARADRIQLEFENLEKGIRVRETSEDPQAVRLIKAHADVVSLFILNGRAEARRDHPVPPAPGAGSD